MPEPAPALPLLAVISGAPGTGKTTLARLLSQQLGCPAIIRDEIKQGLVLATPGYVAGGDDPLNQPALHAFFGTLTVLAHAGVATIAEAAYQDKLWRPHLRPLRGFADIRVVHCTTPAEIAHERIRARADEDPHRKAHGDDEILGQINSGAYSASTFVPVALPVPTLRVDTTDSYQPGLDAIAAFLLDRQRR